MGEIRILAYHGVEDPDLFRAQLEWLKGRYHILSNNDFLKIINGELNNSNKPYAYLTFDDGEFSFYEKGYPVLKELGLEAALFVIPDYVDSQKPFWWDTARSYFVSQGLKPEEVTKRITGMKKISNEERIGQLAAMPTQVKRQLSVEELQEMSENGIKLGNHTFSHPIMTQCSNEFLQEDLNKVKDSFAHWGVGEYDFFAYPNGSSDNRVKELVEKSGIKYAFLFNHQLQAKSNINPLALSRLRVNSTDSLLLYKLKLSGLHSFLLNTAGRI